MIIHSIKYFGRFIIRLLRFIFENWQAKIGSILVAALFYLNLQTSKILVKTVEIPIEYPKLNSGWYYSKNQEKTFRVRVEGFRDLVNYHTQFMKVVIDANDLVIGENLVEVKKIWGASNKIKVTPVLDKIPIFIEQTTSRTIPVDVVFENDLPANYYKASYFLRPNSISISGPKGVIDRISKHILATISLKDIKESFNRTIKMNDLPKGVSLNSGTKEFQLRVNIVKGATDSGEQTVSGIAVKCESLDENLIAEFSVDEISMKFHSNTPIGSYQIFEGIKATVPCTNTFDVVSKKILPNSLPVVAKIRVLKSLSLKNVELLSIIPDRLTITYRPKNSVSPTKEKNTPEIEPLEDWPEPPSEDPKIK